MNSSFADQLKSFQIAFDSALKAALGEFPQQADRLAEAAGYSLLAGGKRIRPYLVKTAAQVVGGQGDNWIQPAIALEMMHCYSLVHDDLPAMDDDDLRRGQPTCHVAFDEATAILVGDGLQSRAFDYLVDDLGNGLTSKQRLSMVKTLARASGFSGMVSGQAIDLYATGRQLTLAELEQMHRLKTGALIEAGLVLGAHCSDTVTEQQIHLLRQYGRTIGLMFQVVDDLLDLEGDTAVLGKPQGSDLHQSKMTYPALMGVEQAREYARQLHQQALECLKELDGPNELQLEPLRQLADYILQRDH